MSLSRANDFDQLLTAAASWLLLGCASWAALIAAAAVLEAVTRGHLRATTWVCCPPALRRVLLAGLGAALVGTPTAAAGAGPAARPDDGHSDASATRQQRLPVPDRPFGRAGSGSAGVVVRQGDTLWQLSEAQLPSPARSAAVARMVANVHERNRVVIGPDPDLIRPGQRLILPTPPRSQNTTQAAPTPRGEP